jgi:biotin synthase
METCGTFGMLKPGQARQLKDAGLDYYNHNLDTAPDKYADVIGTRGYDDRLDTLRQVREAGLNVCCGGIVGMGENP